MLEPVRDIGRIEMRNYYYCYLGLIYYYYHHYYYYYWYYQYLLLFTIIIIIIIITVIVVVVVVVYNSILCPTKPKKVKRLHYLGCASSLLTMEI